MAFVFSALFFDPSPQLQTAESSNVDTEHKLKPHTAESLIVMPYSAYKLEPQIAESLSLDPSDSKPNLEPQIHMPPPNCKQSACLCDRVECLFWSMRDDVLTLQTSLKSVRCDLGSMAGNVLTLQMSLKSMRCDLEQLRDSLHAQAPGSLQEKNPIEAVAASSFEDGDIAGVALERRVKPPQRKPPAFALDALQNQETAQSHPSSRSHVSDQESESSARLSWMDSGEILDDQPSLHPMSTSGARSSTHVHPGGYWTPRLDTSAAPPLELTESEEFYQRIAEVTYQRIKEHLDENLETLERKLRDSLRRDNCRSRLISRETSIGSDSATHHPQESAVTPSSRSDCSSFEETTSFSRTSMGSVSQISTMEKRLEQIEIAVRSLQDQKYEMEMGAIPKRLEDIEIAVKCLHDQQYEMAAHVDRWRLGIQADASVNMPERRGADRIRGALQKWKCLRVQALPRHGDNSSDVDRSPNICRAFVNNSSASFTSDGVCKESQIRTQRDMLSPTSQGSWSSEPGSPARPRQTTSTKNAMANTIPRTLSPPLHLDGNLQKLLDSA